MKSAILMGMFSAAVMTLVAIIVVGTTRWEVAASAAECMASFKDVPFCRVPADDGDIGLVVAVITFALFGFGVGVGGYFVGRRGHDRLNGG